MTPATGISPQGTARGVIWSLHFGPHNTIILTQNDVDDLRDLIDGQVEDFRFQDETGSSYDVTRNDHNIEFDGGIHGEYVATVAEIERMF